MRPKKLAFFKPLLPHSQRPRRLPNERKSPLVFLVTLLVCWFAEDAAGQVPLSEPEFVEHTTVQDSLAASEFSNFTLTRELERVKQRLADLEEQAYSIDESQFDDVDLSDEQDSEGSLLIPTHVLARPWFENFDIWGFAAAGYLQTGKDAVRPNGAFLLKQSTLFIEAQVWDDITAFYELKVVNERRMDDLVRNGEVNVHFRNVFKQWRDGLLGIKVGRIDIPFGEEYLRQDAVDNPLISHSAPFASGIDEGILFYGLVSDLGWIFSVTDATHKKGIDDDSEKAVNLKLFGSPSENLYLSGSFMKTGDVGTSAFGFGGSYFQPVGNRHFSSVGKSPSKTIDAIQYQLDAILSSSDRGYISLSFGQAFVNDSVSFFDRDFLWFIVEGLYNITDTIYGVVRYSEIGTYDSDEGYHFNGLTTAGGNRAFGYDTKRFRRLSCGVGCRLNQHTILKAEVGADWFDVIDTSAFTPENDDRWLAGVELVVGF